MGIAKQIAMPSTSRWNCIELPVDTAAAMGDLEAWLTSEGERREELDVLESSNNPEGS